jgi:hypothetical protein
VRGAALALLGALAGCAPGPVTVDEPDLTPAERERCEALLASLPDTLADLDRREVEPAGAPAAAWGDPPVTAVCGGSMPTGFDRFSACDEVDGVGWYLPPEQVPDVGDEEFGDATLATVGREPVLSLDVPAEYRPEGLAAVLSDLAGPVRAHLEQVRPCV